MTTLPSKTDTLREIRGKCFINAPWYDLKNKRLELFLEHGIQPEIGLEGTCLYDESTEEFTRVSKLLQKAKLQCTLHAPFFDLAAGALDPHILHCSREKLRAAFRLIPIFQPRSIVCHLQYEENKHGYVYQQWFDSALATWRELVTIAERYNMPVMFENTYELTPKIHRHLLTSLNSKSARFCLDVGHLMAFSKTSWQQWLPEMLPWLGQLHLHDNNGCEDSHLAPGRGKFNFSELFDFLKNHKHHPLITFEPHSEKDLWDTFTFLLDSNILAHIPSGSK